MRTRLGVTSAITALIATFLLAITGATASAEHDNGPVITSFVRVPVSASDPDGSQAGSEPKQGWDIWINPADESLHNQLRVTFSHSADTRPFRVLVVTQNPQRRFISETFNLNDAITEPQPGTHTWIVDGVRDTGELVDRGRAYVSIQQLRDYNGVTLWDNVTDTYPVNIHNSTETLAVTDKTGPEKRTAGALNIKSADLTTSPAGITADIAFTGDKAGRTLNSLTFLIDVDRSKRGYYLSLYRDGRTWTKTMLYAPLFSDGNNTETINCSKLDFQAQGRTAQLSIPRSCLPYGGTSSRFYFDVSNARGTLYDYVSDTFRNGQPYTDFITWEPLPQT